MTGEGCFEQRYAITVIVKAGWRFGCCANPPQRECLRAPHRTQVSLPACDKP